MREYVFVIADQRGRRRIGAAVNVEVRRSVLQEDADTLLAVEMTVGPLDHDEAVRVVNRARALLEPSWADGWYRVSAEQARAAVTLAQSPQAPPVDDYQHPARDPDDDAGLGTGFVADLDLWLRS